MTMWGDDRISMKTVYCVSGYTAAILGSIIVALLYYICKLKKENKRRIANMGNIKKMSVLVRTPPTIATDSISSFSSDNSSRDRSSLTSTEGSSSSSKKVRFSAKSIHLKYAKRRKSSTSSSKTPPSKAAANKAKKGSASQKRNPKNIRVSKHGTVCYIPDKTATARSSSKRKTATRLSSAEFAKKTRTSAKRHAAPSKNKTSDRILPRPPNTRSSTPNRTATISSSNVPNIHDMRRRIASKNLVILV